MLITLLKITYFIEINQVLCLCNSDKKTDAEAYDDTSTYDTDHEERGQKGKRYRKEREFPDHLTGERM